MMYFFVARPPKTLLNVSPALSATSTKLTESWGTVEVVLDDCAPVAMLVNTNKNLKVEENTE